MDEQPFLMGIQDVISLQDHDVAVTGHIERGTTRVGDALELVGFSDKPLQVVVRSFVMPQFKITEENVNLVGDIRGVVVSGVERGRIRRGQVLATSGTIGQYRRFRARLDFAENERATKQQPFFGVWRHSLYVWHTDVFATVTMPSEKETINEGDSFEADIDLGEPIALEIGMQFQIGRFVGTGIVLSVGDNLR